MRTLKQIQKEIDDIVWDYEIKQRDSYLKVTDAYKKELQAIYEDWLEDYLTGFENIPEDEQKEYIAASLLLLGRQLKEIQRLRLLEAFTLGLAGEPPSPQSLQNLANHIIEQERYIDTSLVPDLETYLIELEEPSKESLLKRAARVGLYAGAFWAATQLAQRWISQDDRKCTWISRDDEKTCPDCKELDGKHFTAATLPFLPATGHTQCLSNCRCYLAWEGAIEIWPYQGNL